MLEKFKESVDKGNEFGALSTDLSKAFDSTDRKLLVAKLFWYGVLKLKQVLVIKIILNMEFHKARF